MMPGRYGLVGFVLGVYLGVSKMMSGETATNMDEVLWKGRGRLSLYRNGNVPPSVKSVQSHQEDRALHGEIASLRVYRSEPVGYLDTVFHGLWHGLLWRPKPDSGERCPWA